MRIPVKCKNCGIKWVRVTMFGTEIEMTVDLQYNCPKCGSNWCESIEDATEPIDTGAGKVVYLSEDQSLPPNTNISFDNSMPLPFSYPAYKQSQQDMLKAGWRKVELEEKDD